MRCTNLCLGIFLLVVASVGTASAQDQDPGWPRKRVEGGTTLVSYQPQVDEWKNFTDVTWRQAFQLTPAGGKMVLGAVKLSGTTNVDNEKHMVVIYGIQILDAYFPDLDPDTSAKMKQLLRSFIPPVAGELLFRP